MNAKYEKWIRFYTRMESIGFSTGEAYALRRIEMTLSRWAERECNGDIERDEKTDRPFTRRGNYVQANDPRSMRFIPDREKGALKRLAAIMAAHPELQAFHQTDPRGCALYILRPGDVPEGKDPGAYYTSGIAVCL